MEEDGPRTLTPISPSTAELLHKLLQTRRAPHSQHFVDITLIDPHSECRCADHDPNMPPTPVVNHLLLVIGCHLLSMVATALKSTLAEGNCQGGNISDEVGVDDGLSVTDRWNNLGGKVAVLVHSSCSTDSIQYSTYM